MAEDNREMDTFLGKNSESSRSYCIEKDRRDTCHTMGWKRTGLVLVVGIVTGIFIIILSQLIDFVTPTTPDETNAEVAQKWYKTEAFYEIVTESFQDSSPKAKDGLKKGYGVGDIKGIKSRLNYIEDAGSKILYIPSMYESNDDDHMAIVHHKKIDSVIGTMDEFLMLRNATKNKEMRLILDFIPNHTGRRCEWFLKSQRKEEKFSNYYIWAPCDPRRGVYPNDWMSVTGGRAWTYDDKRDECFFHQLEEDKPDLNLWNPMVQQELENILRFWLDKGVDGFHVQNVQYLYEDTNIHSADEIQIVGYKGQTRNHPENAKILQTWKNLLDTYHSEMDLILIADDDDLNTTLRYTDAGVTLVRVNLLSGNGSSLAERVETKLKEVSFKKIAWVFNNKCSSRLASTVGPQQTKALLTLQATVPGVLFNYYGNEIGMTDHPAQPVPFKYRTPMQWNSDGTGFSRNRPWIERNPNYTTINVETEEASGDEYTTLKVYRKVQKLRKKESFQSGEMMLLRVGDLLMYTRKAEGFPGYLVAINFGNKRVIESFYKVMRIPSQVKVVFHSHKPDNATIDLSRNYYTLDPYHAVVLEYK